MSELTLPPIRLDCQIEDAISGYRPEAELAAKLAVLQAHLENIVSINGEKVYNVRLDEQDQILLFTLTPRAATQYYYPVQYAQVEILVVRDV